MESYESKLMAWDIQNQEAEPEVIPVIPPRTTMLGFSPERRCILKTPAKEGEEGEVKLWDANKKSLTDAPKPFQGHPLSIAFSSDGHQIATSQLLTSGPSASTNEQKSNIVIWPWPDGHESVAKFDVNTRVNKMSFSSDHRFLITAGGDAFIHVWDSKTGKEMGRVKLNRPGLPFAMAFTDHDRRVVAFDQYSVRNAPWRPEDLGKAVCERIGRSLSDEEWDKYLPMEKGKYFPTCDAYLHSD
jgi:WD40 repeat protein